MNRLEVTISDEYFEKSGRLIDREGDNSSSVSYLQAREIDKILATEVAINVMRDAEGPHGEYVDAMSSIRRDLIDSYECEYEPYIVYNEYW